ncbi:hypothetical protein A2U01_0071228, partial [Trifolium medium]|nr:hypothetical protein [Trifolium medium]
NEESDDDSVSNDEELNIENELEPLAENVIEPTAAENVNGPVPAAENVNFVAHVVDQVVHAVCNAPEI